MRKRSLFLAAAALSLFPGIAYADDAVPGASDASAPEATGASDRADDSEIVVTARKRSESLNNVPIAITVVSGAEIEAKGLRNLQDVATSVPNLFVGKQPAQSYISLRGLGTVATSPSFEQSVGLSIDGLNFAGARWLEVGLFDLQQLEVLRGPQGVYFGKNTTAGLVNVTSRNPTDEFEGYLSAGYEVKTEEYLGEGVLSGPLSDTFRARLAVRYTNSQGFIRNLVAGGLEPAVESLTGRVTLAWDPTSNFNLVYKGQLSDIHQDGNQELIYCTAAFKAFLASKNSKEQCGATDTRSAPGTYPGGQNSWPHDLLTNTAQSHGLTATLAAGDFTITSVSGYQNLDSNWKRAVGFYDVNTFPINSNTFYTQSQYSQEVRVISPDKRPLQGSIGASFEHSRLFLHVRNDLGTLGSNARDFDQKTDAYAVFGELTWNVSDSLHLTAGGRYTDQKKKLHLFQALGSLGAPFGGGPNNLNLLGWTPFLLDSTYKTDRFSPSFNALWNVTPDFNVYASYKKGFKSGGFDSGRSSAQSAPQAPIPNLIVSDETVEAYELGLKGHVFDNRLELTAALFQSDYGNIQETSFDSITRTTVTLNAASARTKGFEVEARLKVADSFNVSANVGYVDATYRSFPNAPCYSGQTAALGCVASAQNLLGVTLPLAPRWTTAFSADWSQRVFGGAKLELGAQVTTRSRMILVVNNDPTSVQSGFALFNARVALTDATDKWTLAVIGQNLTDKRYLNGATDISGYPGSHPVNIGDPRTVKFQVTHRF